MAKRVELNAKEMEEVIGGAFTYYEDSDGNYVCDIDGYGIVYATYGAKRKITQLYLENKGCSVNELVQMGYDAGVFSDSPLD